MLYFKLYIGLSFIFIYLSCLAGFHPEPPVDSFLQDYDVLNYSPFLLSSSRKRTQRSTSIRNECEHKLHLSAFKQHLSLCLNYNNDLVHRKSKLTIGGTEWPGGLQSITNHIVRGYVQGYPRSAVYGSIINGVFRGELFFQTDSPNSTHPSGRYYIEPAGNYFNYKTPFHSIIYHDQHVAFPPRTSGRVRRSASGQDVHSTFCGLSDPTIVKRMAELSRTPSWLDVKSTHSRSRRASVNPSKPDQSPHLNTFHDLQTGRLPDLDHFHLSSRLYADSLNYSQHQADSANNRVCNLYLQSDTYLWDRIIGLQHINGNQELAVKEITSIFMQHVQGAQAIYQYTVFKDHLERLNFPGISFRVDHVRINITEKDCKPRRTRFDPTDAYPPNLPSPTAMPRGRDNRTSHPFSPGNQTGSYADENPFCAANIDVTNYLNLHSYSQHDDFCLAYIFTYRDFSSGTLGLAWVAEPSGSGGVCERHRLMREGTHTVYKNLNTGVLTLLNYGSQVALKVSQLTFAHELGHNFGAKHDDDHREEPYGCLPSVEDPRGNYIMFASATSGDKVNNNKLSVCSSDAIAHLLDRVISSDSNCFLSSDGPFCGNQLTEEGEECDCGFTSANCRDQCCHPKVSSTPCKLTERIRLNGTLQEVQCSPTAGECCTHNCQYRGQSHLCRAAGECHRSANCNGVDSRCPASVNLPNGTPCQDHTRVCKDGQCLGSICERIPGWHECSLTRDKDRVTPEMMCYVACRENVSGAPCISTYELQQDIELQKQYPNLTSELLHNGRGTQFKPGTPCDNYRGYCDVFLRCQSVVAEGPLVRLHNLLFSPQVLQRIKTWIIVHWWAVILICLGIIVSMIVFVKLFAVSTPTARQQYPGGSRQAFPRPLLPVTPTGAPVLWTGHGGPPLISPPIRTLQPPPYSPNAPQLPSPAVMALSRKQRQALRSRRKQKPLVSAAVVNNAQPPPLTPSAPPLPEDVVNLLPPGHLSEAHNNNNNNNNDGGGVAGQMSRQNGGNSSLRMTHLGLVGASGSESAATRAASSSHSENVCPTDANRARPIEAGRPRLKSRLRPSPPSTPDARTEIASPPTRVLIRAVVPSPAGPANSRARLSAGAPVERQRPTAPRDGPPPARGLDCRHSPPPPAYDEI